jgi:putative intracellular protease/amidase
VFRNPKGLLDGVSRRRNRGANYGKAMMPFASHVVEDGLLITGQNPKSAQAVGVTVVKKLARSAGQELHDHAVHR